MQVIQRSSEVSCRFLVNPVHLNKISTTHCWRSITGVCCLLNCCQLVGDDAAIWTPRYTSEGCERRNEPWRGLLQRSSRHLIATYHSVLGLLPTKFLSCLILCKAFITTRASRPLFSLPFLIFSKDSAEEIMSLQYRSSCLSLHLTGGCKV